LRRSDIPANPAAFIIEGKKVKGRKNTSSLADGCTSAADMDTSSNFDPVAFLESRSISRPIKTTSNILRQSRSDLNTLPSSNKAPHHSQLSANPSCSVSVALSVLYIEGKKHSCELRLSNNMVLIMLAADKQTSNSYPLLEFSDM
jgi:hypothetical protein